MSKPQRSREALVGVAVAGLMVGALTAAVVHSLRDKPPTGELGAQAAARASDGARPEAPTAATTKPGADAATAAAEGKLGEVLDALEAAHGRVHGEGQGAGADVLGAGLVKAVRSDGWLVDLRLAFHEAAGAGALVDGSGPTPLGEALLARLEGLESHGLDPATYGMPTLADEIADFVKSVGGEAVEAPAEAGAAGDVLVELLRAPQLSRRQAAHKLMKAGGTPKAAHVEALAKAMVASRRGPEVEARAAALDAALGRELVRQVLDFRFVRRAGPFKTTRSVEKLVAGKKTRRRVLAALEEIAKADEPAEALAALDPPHPFYARLLEVHDHYRAVSAKGCFKELPTSWRLKLGAEGSEVTRLQERLACEGYFRGTVDGRFGEALAEAVKDYQRHHELEPDGLVYEGTLRSMNVPLTRRAEQIALTLQRWRESPTRDMGDFYIRVNVPAFELQVVDQGEVTRRHKVIVGTNRLDDDKVHLIQGHINRTKLFETRLYEIISNPDWILPVRVEKGEVKKKLAEDPDYLDKKGIVKRKLASGREVLIQRGGKGGDNALGKVKFLLEESNAIYLHDTDKREFFRKLRRDFSHGCVRVHRPLTLAKFLLVRDGWDEREVERSLQAERVQRGMKLRKPVRLVTEYMTVDVAADGGAIFLTDIYGYDKAYEEGDLPPLVQTRWGSPVLRPAWVPKVPSEVVEQWRARGKQAPHDYDPERDGG